MVSFFKLWLFFFGFAFRDESYSGINDGDKLLLIDTSFFVLRVSKIN
jgi:hypothetical protein